MHAEPAHDAEPEPYDPEAHAVARERAHRVHTVADMLGRAACRTTFRDAGWALGVALESLHNRPADDVITEGQLIELRVMWRILFQRGLLWRDSPATWTADMLAVLIRIYRWVGASSALRAAEIDWQARRLWHLAEAAAIDDVLGNRIRDERRAAIEAGEVIDLGARRQLLEEPAL